MDDKEMLMRADELACQILNELKDKRKCDLALTCTVLAVMWGRLRKAGEELGVSTLKMDNQFMHDARIITESLDPDEELDNEKED